MRKPNSFSTCFFGLMVYLCLVPPAVEACSCIHVYKKSESNVVVKLLREGKPVSHVRVEIERSLQENGIPVEHTTNAPDSQGGVSLNLRIGDFYVISVWDELDSYVAELALEIAPDSAQSRSEFEITLPQPPLTEHLDSFRGIVLDASGAWIPQVEIEVTPLGGKSTDVHHAQTDERGRFAMELPDGKYLARLVFRNFSTVKLPVVIAKGEQGSWRGLRIIMKLPDCCVANPYNYLVSQEEN